MRGALRVMVLVFTGYPIQRWLCGIGLLMVIGAYLVSPAGAAGLAFLGLALPVIGPFIDASSQLRLVLSARTTWLIPLSRGKVLAGIALVPLVISSVVTGVVWTLGLERLLHVAPGTLWLRIEVISSIFLVLQFLFSGTPFGVVWWLAVFGMIIVPVVRQSPAAIEMLHQLATNDPLLAEITAAVWLCFGTWFLRVPTFVRPYSPGQYSTRVRKIEVDNASARRTLLMGTPSIVRNPLVTGTIGGVLLAAVWWLALVIIARLSHRPFAEWAPSSMGPVLGCVAFSGRNSFGVANRAKLLWLKTELDRQGLFKACEKVALRHYATVAFAFTFLPIASWLANPGGGLLSYALVLAFNIGLGTCGVYLVLMHVRGWRAFDITCAITLVILWLAAIGSARAPVTYPLTALALIAATGVAALGLRLVALYRWRRVDWLICKPPRPAARPAGLAG